MTRAEGGKSVFLRNVPTDLVREAKAAAARRGETLTTIVAEALARSLRVHGEPDRRSDGRSDDRSDARADDLDAEIAWYRKQRSLLLRRYGGEYVAIVDRVVVDHGRDFGALATRVFARFGNRSVYMPRVQPDEPTVRIRSPRRSTP
jgi:hypothetical protein